MRALLLCCVVALAVCQESRLNDHILNPKKIYEYKYEGQVKFGLGKSQRAESGAKLKSTVKIVGQSSDTFLLKFSNVVFEEFNGISGKSDFVAATELADKIAQQLAKPITFTYSAGNVREIRASPDEVTDTVLNIVRGILDFFQVTIKTTQEIYELEEVGVHGKCLSSYAIKTNDTEKVMTLTQVVDVTKCREKAAFYTGLATAVEDKVSKQRGESLFSTVKYTYKIETSEDERVIINAQALELQYFTPFNVKKGTLRMEVNKKLERVSVTNKPQDEPQDTQLSGQMKSRGNLMYKIVKNNANIPVVMQKLDNPVTKAEQLIEHLAQANAQHIDSTTTEETIKLYQLLRMIPKEKLIEMWRTLQTKEKRDQRQWFLHTVVEVNDDRILHFLEEYLRDDTTLSLIEVITVIVQAFSHLEASTDQLRLAEKFLSKSYSRPLIRQTMVLSYGSLVFKHCAYHTHCNYSVIEPLLRMANNTYSSKDEMEKILVLKALGNAGHPRSLKTIMRFLPGVDPNPDRVDKNPRVVSAAVQAMRLITRRDPHQVQVYTLKLFLNRELEAELRMLAFMIMFDTKPSMALVSTVTAHLLEEKDMQVVNFAHTYLRSLARSTTPENHYLSTAASVAVKMLAPKFARLSYSQSRATRMDFFHDDYLIGTAVEAVMLKRASQIIPAEMMVKQNFYFLGRILQLMEFGMRIESLRDLIGKEIPGFKGDLSKSDFYAVYDVLKKWESLPDKKPVFSFYTRVSGQEFYYSDFSKECLKMLMEIFSQSRKDIIDALKTFSWRGVLPFLTAEARYIQATTLGFPVEISKYYHVVSGMKVQGSTEMNPQITEDLGQLLTSNIKMKIDGYIGYTKDLWLFYGINTDLFQSAIEIKTTNPVAIPINLLAEIHIPTRRFHLEIPRSKEEFELLSIRSKAYAISRNIIHPEAAKKTPIVPSDRSVTQGYSQVMLKHEPNRWHSVKKNCSESKTYGFALCHEIELQQEYYQEEYPLYKFLGSTDFVFKFKPVDGSTVDKIRLEIDAKLSSSLVNVRQLIDALRRKEKDTRPSTDSASHEPQERTSRGIEGSPVPLVRVKVLAMNSTGQRGYDALLYYTNETERYSTQLIMLHIGDSSHWKMCMDAAVDAKAKVNIGWGKDCETYAMFMRAERGNGNRPELKAFFHWDKLPESMELYGRRLYRYIPGVAFFLGFNQEEETNTMQEVSASVIAASADSINLKIKFPKLTLCHEALPSPVPPAYFQ